MSRASGGLSITRDMIMNSRFFDPNVLEEMKRMFRQGYRNCRAGTLAKRLMKRLHVRIDSLMALGAMERVKRDYYKWVNKEVV